MVKIKCNERRCRNWNEFKKNKRLQKIFQLSKKETTVAEKVKQPPSTYFHPLTNKDIKPKCRKLGRSNRQNKEVGIYQPRQSGLVGKNFNRWVVCNFIRPWQRRKKELLKPPFQIFQLRKCFWTQQHRGGMSLSSGSKTRALKDDLKLRVWAGPIFKSFKMLFLLHTQGSNKSSL